MSKEIVYVYDSCENVVVGKMTIDRDSYSVDVAGSFEKYAYQLLRKYHSAWCNDSYYCGQRGWPLWMEEFFNEEGSFEDLQLIFKNEKLYSQIEEAIRRAESGGEECACEDGEECCGCEESTARSLSGYLNSQRIWNINNELDANTAHIVKLHLENFWKYLRGA